MTNSELIELYWNERRTDRLGAIFHDPYTQGQVEGPLTRLVETIDESIASSTDCTIEIRSTHGNDDLIL